MNILITAGPTREYIDAVRFISNPSTGKMGFAIAEAAKKRGHRVVLIAGPVALTTPEGVTRIDVTSALEMYTAVLKEYQTCDAYISTAAIADFRPANPSNVKLKKATMPRTIDLTPNPDILLALKPIKENKINIGFAAETGESETEAKRKLAQKNLDLIVANDVTVKEAGFGTETNQVTFIEKNGEIKKIPLMTKLEIGNLIVQWLEKNHPTP